jgi:asparagine synthase (glutamine-hydrolysing)
MCGIVGYTGPQENLKLEKMLQSIIHRGPDEDGIYNDDHFHLGMRRLSIIDVAGGKQPIYSQNKKCLLLYNGEIYNYLELKKKLIHENNIKFVTNTDTEVIANLYEIYGLNFLNMLEGMFAIALLDLTSKKFYLIRDRYGKKPIYYKWNEDNFSLSFSSEFKTLFTAELFKFSDEALTWYFSQKSTSSEFTIDKSIQKIPPAHYLIYEQGKKPIFFKYYNLDFKIKKTISETDALTILEKKLHDSVNIRMRADVEVGTFLSGGIDSSLVSVLASHNTSKPLKSYCLIYNEQIAHKASDKHFSELISKQINSDHHEVLLTPELFEQELPQIIKHYREPNCAVFSMWFIAREMKKSLKVALSGDGADELFGSYFLPRALWWRHEILSNKKTRILNELRDYERTFFDESFDLSFNQLLDRFSVFPINELNQLLKTSCSNYILKQIDQAEKIASSSDFTKALKWDWENLLVNQVLNYSDQLAMAHSIEVRCPFLDSNLVEFLTQIPDKFKINENETKYLLKKLAERYLPRELIYRPKEGFIEPSLYWMRTHLKTMVDDYIFSKSFNLLGKLNKEYAQNVVKSYMETGDYSKARKAWSLFVYAIWEKVTFNNV